MSKPRYTSAAHADLVSILEYIARDKPSAALSWVEKIEAKCLLIAESPEIGELQPQFGEGVRSSVVGRYVIFHRQTESGVEILRVIAGDRAITEL
jgi:toxin ParE1/3/4